MANATKSSKSHRAWRKLLAAAWFFGAIGFVGLQSHDSKQTVEGDQRSTVAYSSVTMRKVVDEERQSEEDIFQTIQEAASAEDYCAIAQCESITCSYIPVQFDSGKVASSFIDTVYKVQCPGANSLTLTFHSCRFPSNKLQENWLPTALSVKDLSFHSCSLNEINENAFFGDIYEETEVLSIIDNKISSLYRNTFRNLPNLQRLVIQDNPLKYAEFNLLQDVASSLQVLHLEGLIRNVDVLRNVTGGTILPAVQLLSIRGNSIGTIDRTILVGVPRVRSLYVDRSEVIDVERDAFLPLARSIEQLFMNDNNIASLPNGLFDSILRFNRQFRLTISNNPWHCDCPLKWMQELIENYPYTVTTVPICQTPEDNASLPFTKAKFCNDSGIKFPTTSTAITEPTTRDDYQNPSTATSPQTSAGPAELACQIVNSLPQQRSSYGESRSMANYQLAPRFPNFSVAGLNDGSVAVGLPKLDTGVTILWFSNSHSEKVDSVIRCAKNVRRSLYLSELEPNTDYSVCLLDEEDVYFSPLNCLAVSTRPKYAMRAWIVNKNKAAILSISIVSMVLLCTMSALVMLLIVRRNPTLLRGSKRVLMVKRRSMDAIVLPNGFYMRNYRAAKDADSPSSTRSCRENGYVTPLPANKLPARKDSRASGMSLQSSGTSYVSGIEPTLFQLASWRLKRLKSDIESRINPPPIPPHRKNGTVPSLSMSVDFGNENTSADVISIMSDL